MQNMEVTNGCLAMKAASRSSRKPSRWGSIFSIALHEVVRAGKARYIGASAMFAWQFQKALHVAEKYGWTRFVSMQDHLNLIYREEKHNLEKSETIKTTAMRRSRRTRHCRLSFRAA
jgi:hypothetical protein